MRPSGAPQPQQLPFFEGSRQAEDEDESQRVHGVAELNRIVRRMLEDRFVRVWVEGELSDVTKHGSGHVYFTLNDPVEAGQIRGVMFRSDARRAKAELRRGAKVRFRGSLSLYAERGAYQLVARIAVPAGEGALHAQFERLKKKLSDEGLLAAENKRTLPAYPRRVGVATSAQGAALQDIIRVARERFPVHLLISDCRVQGSEAPSSIVRALQRLDERDDLDAIIVARGGGSGEDLWAFNDEAVARAIAACRVPVVCGVGHETDITIADLVADARAATPSNAVEQLLPERAAVAEQMRSLTHRLERIAEARLDRERLRLARLSQRVLGPPEQLRALRPVLERLHRRLEASQRQRLQQVRKRLQERVAQLRALDARSKIRTDRNVLAGLERELRHSAHTLLAPRGQALAAEQAQLRELARHTLSTRREALSSLTGKLGGLDPNAVLRRGYAIALHEGRAVLESDQVGPGQPLQIRLHRGTLDVRVEQEEDKS